MHYNKKNICPARDTAGALRFASGAPPLRERHPSPAVCARREPAPPRRDNINYKGDHLMLNTDHNYKFLPEALTFDDILMVPAHSSILPADINVRTRLAGDIHLNTPLISAAMDTVTESRMAIAMAREGGIGVIHKNMPLRQQADQIDRVKRSENGVITESEAQELVDHIVMKFRMVKFARITSYQELFSGDPVWATLEVGGTGLDGRSMVTKNDYRFLHTLENMGPSPEPNMTVLYTSRLPEAFKKYAAHISIVSSSIQYENDDVMKPVWGDDYSICCCVSATQTGKEMQFFGARANLLKALLYAINGGMDEKLKTQVGPCYAPITTDELTWDIVKPAYLRMLDWLAGLYVNVLNLIHYMHDKYYYEAAEMALIDTHVKRSFATGIAGFSHCVDSISALKYAKVTAIRDESGMVYDYKTEGEFPKYGNDDDRADDIAKWLLKTFIDMVKKHHTYRESEPTTSILTITSNVVYGKATGALPDGRKAGAPLSPGANPSYGAEQNGLLASLNSVAKLPYEWALDGISNTQTINPDAIGHTPEERINNLVNVMDGYFSQGAHHLNVNVFGTEKLLDAMEHPEKEEYANFTIRVSGYAGKFIDLTREQQLDVIARTCHDRM